MEPGKQAGKASSSRKNLSQNDLASLQQQMTLAAQLGMVPGMLDPSMINSGSNVSEADLQRLLAMQTGGFSLMDPAAALHAFGGLGGGLPLQGLPPVMLPGSMPGNGSDWLTMANQAQLLGGLGGAPNSMLSQLFGANFLLNSSLAQNAGVSGKSSFAKTKSDLSGGNNQPSLSSSPAAHGYKELSRPSSNASSSRVTPSGMLSPGPSTVSRPPSKPRPLSSTPRTSTKETKIDSQRKKSTEATDQLIQAEMVRQLEQQFLLQQLQLQQQKKHLEAALTAINIPTERQRSNPNRRQESSNASQNEKLQQRLSESIYQQLLSAGPYLPAMGSAMNSYFGSQQIMDQMVGLGQSSSSNNVKEKSSSSSHGKSSNITSSVPSLDQNKKSHHGRGLNDHSSKENPLPTNIFDRANSTTFAGDPNTDKHLAALCSQLQSQKSNEAMNKTLKTSGKNKSSVFEKSLPTANQISPKAHETLSASSKSTLLNDETTAHKRKQPNPMSINNLCDVSVDEEIAEKISDSLRRTPTVTSSDSCKNSNKQETPSSNQEVSLTNCDPKLPAAGCAVEPVQSSSSRDVPKSSESLSKDGEVARKQSDSKSSAESFSEKDLMAFIQALTSNPGSSGSQSLERIEKLLSTCSNLLRSGQNMGLNAVNELLTAVVTTEMQRLQTEKANLTRELKLFNKNDTLTALNKQVSSDERDSTSGMQEGKQSRKRRRAISDEDEVLEPLRQGWKREIKLRRVGTQLKGEVFYHTPDEKKLRTFPELLKYLDENKIDTLHRNNFSFSSRLKVGSFYQQKDESKIWTKLTEAEVDRHLGIAESDDPSVGTSASDDNQNTPESRHSRQAKTVAKNLSLHQAIEEKLNKDEESEAVKQAIAEIKMQQREQRKLEVRLQREMKERQLLEERRKAEAARQLAKYQEAMRKDKEREERRRHLLFIRNLETKRRAEERDRRREEMKNERIYIREKKMEQRKLAMKLAREMKQPVEDLCLTTLQPLPKMKSLQGTIASEKDVPSPHELSGAATADVVMVLEFLHTFKNAIFIDEKIIPSFTQLQRGLLNDPDHVESLVKLTMALLHQCLCDPGVPAPGPWLHCLIGVKVIDLDVSKGNYSEILRLFLWGRNRQKNEITDLLETEPFPSLNADQKAGILAFLVNELVCSRPVCDEIDKHLENLATLRRDKWIVEGKIRQARIEQANDGSDVSTSSPLKSKSKAKSSNDEELEEKGEKEEVCKDDESVTSDNKPPCRSDTLMERKMKRLTKEHQSFNERLFSDAKPLRAFEMGQDRYKRRYWVLSNLGGIYVEGLESGGWFDNDSFEDDKQTDVKTDADDENRTKTVQNGLTHHPSISASTDVSTVTTTDQPTTGTQFLPTECVSEKPCCSTEHLPSASTLVSKAPGASSPSSCVEDAKSKEETQKDIPSLEERSKLPPNANSIMPTTPDHNSCSVKETAPNSVTNHSTDAKTPPSELPTPISAKGSLPGESDGAKKPPLAVPSFSSAESNMSPTAAQVESNIPAAQINKDPTEPCSPKDPNKKVPTKNEEIVKKSKDDLSNPEEDEVEAAARAIAARAVAASSHLLYPQSQPSSKSSPARNSKSCAKVARESPVVSAAETLQKSSATKETSSVFPSSNATALGTTSISKHMAEALQSIGMAANSLSAEQLQALMHYRNNEHLENNFNLTKLQADVTTSAVSKNILPQLPINNSVLVHTEQDAPMDLSKPSVVGTADAVPPRPLSSSSSTSSLSIRPIKSEPPSFDFPFYYAGMNQMVAQGQFFIKSEGGRMAYASQELFDVKPTDVIKDPIPIPKEMKQGWWRIASEEEFDRLCNSLHCRGMREKHLQRVAMKHKKYCLQAIEQANAPEFQFSSETRERTNNEKKENGEKKEEQEKEESIPDDNHFEESDVTALNVEMELLQQIDDLVDKCFNAGVFHEKTEHLLESRDRRCNLSHVPYEYDDDDDDETARHDWLNPIPHPPDSALGCAVDLMKKVERAVNRTFLKPPLVRKGGVSEYNNLSSLSESNSLDIASGLKTWRNAVATATSASQLSICVAMLDSCINWKRAPKLLGTNGKKENSKGKKKAREKRPGGKSPVSGKRRKKMPKMMDNDNLSDDSLSNSRIDQGNGIDSGSKPLLINDRDEKQEDALPEEPPLNHSDLMLTDDSILQESVDSSGAETIDHNRSEVSLENGENAIDKKEEKKKKKRRKEKEKTEKPKKRRKTLLGACKEILRHLQAHEMAAWFLFPVDPKAVPDYRKIIKNPMDFKTIESRLRRKKYKLASDFVDDVRTVFDNCQIFNEDDSPIGRAGHTLRALFEGKWAVVMDNMDLEEPIG